MENHQIPNHNERHPQLTFKESLMVLGVALLGAGCGTILYRGLEWISNHVRLIVLP